MIFLQTLKGLESTIIYNHLFLLSLHVENEYSICLTFWLDWYLQGSIPSLNLLIREILSDKKLEEVPIVSVIAYP